MVCCIALCSTVKHSLCKFIKFYMLQTCALRVCVLVVIHENVRLVPKGLILSFSGKSEHIFCWLFKWETVRPSNCASLNDAHTCFSCTYSLPTLANWKGWGRHSCSNCWVMLPFNWSLPLNKAIGWTARETGAGLPETGGCDGSKQKEDLWAELLFCQSRLVFLHLGYKRDTSPAHP